MSDAEKWKRARTWFVLAVYAAAMLFFFYKMMFYTERIGNFPDERAHVSYIVYLEANHKLIPHFADMSLLNQKNDVASADTIDSKQNYDGTFTLTGTFNYLGHPPLYYQIIRLSGGVRVYRDGTVTVDIMRLRYPSMAIALLAMLLIFYIGFTRIGDSPVLHLLYAAICTSVPMLAYDCAGINNDTLSFFGMAVLLLGILRFMEKKRNAGTYWLIAAGVFVSALAKLTTCTIVLLSIILLFVYLLLTEKNMKFLLSKKFLPTIPAYLAVAAYYIAVRLQTGEFQPSYSKLSPQQFLNSGFYIAPAQRSNMSTLTYIHYFADNFLRSWTGIASHVTMVKKDSLFSLNSIGLEFLFLLPLLALIPLLRGRRKGPTAALLACYFAAAATVAVQFMSSFRNYRYVTGYEGGFQSRYYLCCIPVFALAIVFGLRELSQREKAGESVPAAVPRERKLRPTLRKIGVPTVCVLYALLLFYEDFPYLFINYRSLF